MSRGVDRCRVCRFPLKPNVVLFGEPVRHLTEIQALLEDCDLLLVIGTSAQVFSAADLPRAVRQRGGLLYEFNMEQTRLSGSDSFTLPMTDYFFQGASCATLPFFVNGVLD